MCPNVTQEFEILSAVTFFYTNFADVIYGFKFCSVHIDVAIVKTIKKSAATDLTNQ